VILQGQRVRLKKVRVKQVSKDMELMTYAALQSFDLLQDRVLRHMMSVISTRQYDGLVDEVSEGNPILRRLFAPVRQNSVPPQSEKGYQSRCQG
jgi:hypothetical protein